MTEDPESPEKPAKSRQGSSDKMKETPDLSKLLGELYETSSENEGLLQGLANLHSIPGIDPPPTPVRGKPYERGVMGFRRVAKQLTIAIACGKAQVRYIDLQKYIAMVEHLHDKESATIMLQNFQDQDEYKSAKGQVLGRINAKSSAIQIIQGLTGRIIHNPSDIALFDVYYLDRADMTSFYLAAKAQISNEDELDSMIAAYDGWKAFNVPLDPWNPYEAE